jgi:hypothetical protein
LLTLTNLRLLGPRLTTANVEALLKEAEHKSKHEIEQLVARLRPEPPVPSRMRKLAAKAVPTVASVNPGEMVAPHATSPSAPMLVLQSSVAASRHSFERPVSHGSSGLVPGPVR